MRWRTMRPDRWAGIAIWAVILLGWLLAGLVLAVDLGAVWNAQAELRTVADAAAVAAGHAWAENLVPYPDGPRLAQGLDAAYRAACRVTESSGDGSLRLFPNPDNLADGDIVFGFYDRQTGFAPASKIDLSSPWLNAVRIRLRRDQEHGNPPGLIFGPLFGWSLVRGESYSIALLERRIVGFRCSDGRAIPLVPIALLSDPTGQTPDAWENQLAAQGVLDGGFPSGEALTPTVTIRLPIGRGGALAEGSPTATAPSPEKTETVGQTDMANACLLRIGTASRAETVRQTLTGILPRDLDDPELSGELTIDTVFGYCPVAVWLDGFSLADAELPALVNALTAIQNRGEVRIWPLYLGLVTDLSEAKASGNHGQTHEAKLSDKGQSAGKVPGLTQGTDAVSAAVNGFVAARILHLEMKMATPGATGSPFLEITLEPRVLITRTAIPIGGRQLNRLEGEAIFNPYLTQPNPYLLRIQLVE